MRAKTLASALVLSVLAPAAPAHAAVSEFRLPSERPTPDQPPPDLQGPVAPDVPESRRRADQPTPAPSASRVDSPAPSPAVEVPAGLQATAAPAARPAAAPAPTGAPAAPATAAPPGERAPPDRAAAPVAVQPQPSPATPAAAAAPQAGLPWPWLLAAVPLLLAALGAAGWAVRRRARRPARPVAAPTVERPRVAPTPAAPAEPLQVSLEPVRLSLTLVNATLAYRLALANRGTAALTGLAIGADMISAHASMSREEQLSGPRAGDGDGSSMRRIDRLEPGESRVIDGVFRLPLPEIVPIRQGNAALLLPLARFRVVADGAAPLVRTFAVGQPGQGNHLQPFRLDQGPRIFPLLTQHAFA